MGLKTKSSYAENIIENQNNDNRTPAMKCIKNQITSREAQTGASDDWYSDYSDSWGAEPEYYERMDMPKNAEQNTIPNQPAFPQDSGKPVSKTKGRMARAIDFLRENLDDGIELEVEIDITPIVNVVEFVKEKYKNLKTRVKKIKNNQNGR